jgi:hypothetical protein
MQWSTIRIVMVLAATLGLHSVQYDITAAFIHGRIPPEEEIYMFINLVDSNAVTALKSYDSSKHSMGSVNHPDISSNISLTIWSGKVSLPQTLIHVYS